MDSKLNSKLLSEWDNIILDFGSIATDGLRDLFSPKLNYFIVMVLG